MVNVGGATCNPCDVSLVWLVASALVGMGVEVGRGRTYLRRVWRDMAGLLQGVEGLVGWAPFVTLQVGGGVRCNLQKFQILKIKYTKKFL